MKRTIIVPLNDRVLVKRLSNPEEKTKGGLFIPDVATEAPQQGVVLAAGEGRLNKNGDARIPLNVIAGDVILFGKYSGNEVVIQDEKYLILKEDEILSKLKEVDEPDASDTGAADVQS
jgi:chaperonin GroES